jgi:hypothetical protein
MKIDTDKFMRKFEENPAGILAAAGLALTGVAKIVQAAGNARGSNAYAKQVNHRIKRDRFKNM